MSGIVTNSSNPYLHNADFYQQLQNQYYQNSSQLINQIPLNFYQVNENGQPHQNFQPNYFNYQSPNFQLPMHTTFQPNSFFFQQPSAQNFYQIQNYSPWASNSQHYQQEVSSPDHSVSSSNVQLDQSLLSPSLQDTSDISAPDMSPHLLQYQWQGSPTPGASNTYPELGKTLDLETQNQMLLNIPVSFGQDERYVVREVKYSSTDDCPDQLVIQLDEKPDISQEAQTETPRQSTTEISTDPSERWHQVLRTIGLDLQDLPDIGDDDLNETLPLAITPLPQGPHSSFVGITPESSKASSICATSDGFEDDFDEDLDRGVAYPAGSTEQTRVLASSNFMKNMRKFVDNLKATRGHLLTIPVVKPEMTREIPEKRKMVQPKRRGLTKDLNQGIVPDIIQLDTSKLDGTGIFNFGRDQWTMSFENNYKFKEFFFEGKLKHLTEEILRHCLGNDLSLYTLTGSSYIQRELSAVHQHVQKITGLKRPVPEPLCMSIVAFFEYYLPRSSLHPKMDHQKMVRAFVSKICSRHNERKCKKNGLSSKPLVK